MRRARVTEVLAYGTALDRLTGPAKTVAPARKQGPVEPAGTARIKLSVFLNQEEDSYLETLSSTAKFSGGRKISKTRLVEAMVRGFRASKLDVRGVKTDEELLRRVIAQLR